jgi:dolichol-phosphate mannosyltransferase
VSPPPLTPERRGTLSVVVPTRDEVATVAVTLANLERVLDEATVPFELVVVDDGSRDGTRELLAELATSRPRLHVYDNRGPHGFGAAVRHGLAAARGDAVVLVMADGSDDPADVVRFWQALGDDTECVFGSRFLAGGSVRGYPRGKLVLNRLGNAFIRLLFAVPYDDVTNAFKLYRRHVIEGVQPLRALDFDLTVELPLRAIAGGYRYVVLPNAWYGRPSGRSKFRVVPLAVAYLRTVLRCWWTAPARRAAVRS